MSADHVVYFLKTFVEIADVSKKFWHFVLNMRVNVFCIISTMNYVN
jgi:hypothetical protein